MTEDDEDDKDRYRRGLPDHHDPTAGIGGAEPALSALTLRLVLASLGFLLGLGFAIWAYVVDAPTRFIVFPAIIAVIAAINIVVVARRKARGEPG